METSGQAGKLQLVYTIFCDDVRLEVGNKLSLMGVFHQIVVQHFNPTTAEGKESLFEKEDSSPSRRGGKGRGMALPVYCVLGTGRRVLVVRRGLSPASSTPCRSRGR